jgi:hypothetical protein
MSFIIHPDHKNQYLATIRVSHKTTDCEYPMVENKVYLVRLDSSFQVIESNYLLEPARKIYTSYTTGLEDCRLINGTTMTGVLLDNSENWIPEMCMCKFNRDNYQISKIIVFNTSTSVPKPEKNWLVLNSSNTMNECTLFMLYSYEPFRIMSVNVNNGECQVVHFQKMFNLDNCEVHGGACVYLERERKYLIVVRIISDHKYMFSMWILLNEQYKVCGTSKPFLFSEGGINKNEELYEMCMSLVEKKDFLYVSLSINDQDIYVYEYLLNDIITKTTMANI